MLKPLEFKEYKENTKEELDNRVIIIKKYLNLKNVRYTKQYNIKRKYYIYLYYFMGEIIEVEKEKLQEILKLVVKNDLILENKQHFSNKPLRIIKFLNIFPENNNYFNFQDLYHKDQMENIDKYKLPLYKVMKENKYALLNLLKSHFLNYTDEDINYFLVHDRFPFLNYQHLKDNLKKYHGQEKEKYYKIFKNFEEDAHVYLLGRHEVIVTQEPEGYNVYTKEPYRGENEEKNMRNLYINKLDNQVSNNLQLFLDNMSNKEIINLEIKNNTAEASKDKNYHFGYYGNGIYKCPQEFEKEENISIDKNLLEIEILPDYEKFYSILLKINETLIELDYFYIPDDKEFILEALLEKLWQRGYFLSDFGKAVYINEKEILNTELRTPKWLTSYDKESFEELIKKINNLNK